MSQGILVHEWLARTGGSENVFDALVETFAEADILCLWNDLEGRYPGRNMRETWLARTPLRRHKAAALPFMPATWRNRAPAGYDWALISSHLFAHHVSFANQSESFRKYAYVHSPARYIWTPDLDRRGAGLVPRALSPTLRKLDRKRAQELHAVAANSNYVKQRISETWDRDATVIYPPVDVDRIRSRADWSLHLSKTERDFLESLPSEFILGASRFVPYKGLNRVIEMGETLRLPVVIAGSGPEESNLRHLAAGVRVSVAFVIAPSDALLFSLYQRSLAYIFPAIEDFGIMPVEAMASGTPVLANAIGGAGESVMRCEGGLLLATFDPDEVRHAFDQSQSIERAHLPNRTDSFSNSAFHSSIREWVQN